MPKINGYSRVQSKETKKMPYYWKNDETGRTYSVRRNDSGKGFKWRVYVYNSATGAANTKEEAREVAVQFMESD